MMDDDLPVYRSRLLCPGGTIDTSPAIHCWEVCTPIVLSSPGGTIQTICCLSARSSLRDGAIADIQVSCCRS